MPKNHDLPALSEAQLEILNVIWSRGECAVADVWKVLHERRGISRNTIHTLIVRLEEKGWLTHREASGGFLYRATATREETQQRTLQKLIENVFNGSAEGLVLARAERRHAFQSRGGADSTTHRQRQSEEAMNAVHGFVLTLFFQITAITAIALLALQILRGSAPLRYALAVTAMYFLLVSPVLTLILPRASWFAGFSSRVAPNNSAPIEISDLAGADLTSHPKAADAMGNRRIEVAPAAIAGGLWATNPQVSSPTISPDTVERQAQSGFAWARLSDWPTWWGRIMNLACGMWLVGVVVLARRFFLARRDLGNFIAGVRLGSLPANTAEEARKSLGVAKLPPIAVSDLTPLPVVLGCWRPLVVLPRQFVETASSTRLRDVLIHECAHIVRGDPASHALQQLAAVIFWPHPGTHWLNREINRAREEVCDNFVLQRPTRPNMRNHC